MMWETVLDFIFGMEDKFLRIGDWRNMTVEKVDAYAMNGAEASFIEEDGWTVLMQAAIGGAKPGVLRRLVELGADPNLIDIYGLKADDYATNEVSKNVLRNLCNKTVKTITQHNIKPINSQEHIKE